jgi:U5 small nuclear ribonucleoprotein component
MLEQIEHCYSGPLDSELANAMFKCDPNGPLMINITKLYPNKDATRFDAFGRIFSGRIKLGESVKVLGENYSLEDEEDMALAEVTGVYISESRSSSFSFSYQLKANTQYVVHFQSVISLKS